MTVAELIEKLKELPQDFEIASSFDGEEIQIYVPEEEGNRLVYVG